MHKNALFLMKSCKKKSPIAGGSGPDPLASGGCGSFATRLPASGGWGLLPKPSPLLTNPSHTTDKSSRFLQAQIA